jgi:hypothetical protein
MKTREDQFRRTAGDVVKRAAKGFVADCGIFRTFIVSCAKFVIYV